MDDFKSYFVLKNGMFLPIFALGQKKFFFMLPSPDRP